MYMEQGVQLLTVGSCAGCPADSGYIRAGGVQLIFTSTRKCHRGGCRILARGGSDMNN